MASFEFEGQTVTVLAQHMLELGDLAYIKEHFGIAGLVPLELGMADMDPDAWRAILIASIRRAQPEVAPDHPGINEVEILPLIQELNRERDERLAAEAAAGGGRPTAAPRRRSSRASAGTSS